MKKVKIVVISLFDGLSGARVALSRVPKIEVLRYYSSEVDKYAIQIANKNFPQDEPFRLGDVTKIDGYKLLKDIKAEFGNDVKILLIGGSPCQGFSMSGKRRGSSTKDGVKVTELEQYLQLKKDGFEFDGQSYLFWEYKRIQNEIKPDWFLLENVKVTGEWLPMFNEAMEVDAVFINSDIVSAQNRPRYYWTNLGYSHPSKTNKEVIKDILEPNAEFNKKYANWMLSKWGEKTRLDQFFHVNRKASTLTAQMAKGQKASYCINSEKEIHKFSPIECERLQTLKDNYTKGVSTTQRLKAIGNGFTIDVIVGFLKSIVTGEVKKVQHDLFSLSTS